MDDTRKRIEQMENKMNQVSSYTKMLESMLDSFSAMEQTVEELWNYYENGEWMADYQLDEAGEVPESMPRGILSEDGLYNVLGDFQDVRERLINLK
ncbi:MAG: DUF4298 domain-containing protein [Arcanobacterium sp.]|nr:DUF4298 domain-containing protein [Arcanobacterium sp.]